MIGIIGFGRFGKLIARYLAEDFNVYVYNRTDKASQIKKVGANVASLKETCSQDIVIWSLPISYLEEGLKNISSYLNENAVMIDVCSVKEYTIKCMLDNLPDSVSILATHPMFGPDSAGESLIGRKVVLCKVRIEDNKYQQIKDYLLNKGLKIIETSAEEHDKQIAVTLFLTHFIGRTLSEFGAKKLDIDTEGYKRLLHILDVVENDSWQLFFDMHKYNSYANEIKDSFINAMKKINEKLN
jgi:prephenate dehydrogenase